MITGVPSQRPATAVVGLPHGALALAGLTGTAGLIHFVAMVEHIGVEWELTLFFALVGAAQVAAGWRIYRGEADARLLKLVAVGSVLVALLWVFSRTTGIPVGPQAGSTSEVGVGDTIATLLELASAGLAGTILWRGDQRVAWLSSGLGIRLTFAVLSLALLMAAFGGHEH